MRLLQKDPMKRIGYKGADEIKKHRWFEQINWWALQRKKIRAPFIPKLRGETDTINFSRDFTKLPIQLFRNNEDLSLQFSLEEDDKFQGFSYFQETG